MDEKLSGNTSDLHVDKSPSRNLGGLLAAKIDNSGLDRPVVSLSIRQMPALADCEVLTTKPSRFNEPEVCPSVSESMFKHV